MIALLAALLAVITAPYSPASYACDGSTAVFQIPFPYQAYTDLTVTSTTSGGAVTTLVYTTNYTVNVTSTTTTATLTLIAPASSCPSGNTLKIARVVVLTQLTSFRMQNTFNAALHEMVYDRLEMQIQQLNSGLLPAGTIADASLLSAYSGVGSCSAHQWVNLLTRNAAPTCAQPSYSDITGTPTIPTDISGASYITKVAEAGLSNEFALGSLATGILKNTTTTGVPTIAIASTDYAPATSGSAVLLGNGSGGFSNYGGATSCTNQFFTGLSSIGASTCTTDTLASAQHANQGTTTTVLHGNAAGNPTWAQASLTADVTGILPQANGGTGAGALSCTATQVLTSNGTVYSCATPPGIGSTGSAVPSTAQYQGGKDSNGNLLGLRTCDKSLAIAQASLNGSAQLVAGVASTKIYICGGFVVGSAAVNVKFIEGTGSNCATGPADVTGATPLAANGGYSLGLNAFAVPFTATTADALCINTSGVVQLGGWISYTQGQ